MSLQIINIKNGIEGGLEGAVIAIGNFDGVHKGHQEIIRRIKDKGERDKRPVGILTFEPNPLEFFLKEIKNYKLTSFRQKTKILEGLGLDFVAYAEFNEQFSEITAEDFVKKILVDKLKVSHVFTGEDFKFGYRAKGDAALFAELSKRYGFGYTPVEKILDKDGVRYSSTRIRKYLTEGKLKPASDILGRDPEIEGTVVEGAKKGRELGYSTANIELDNYVLPKFGVYKVEVTGEGFKKAGVANIGIRPTFGNNRPLLEVHIFDFNDNIYGKNLSVVLKSFIREEIKFDSVSELKEQIRKDVAVSKK